MNAQQISRPSNLTGGITVHIEYHRHSQQLLGFWSKMFFQTVLCSPDLISVLMFYQKTHSNTNMSQSLSLMLQQQAVQLSWHLQWQSSLKWFNGSGNNHVTTRERTLSLFVKSFLPAFREKQHRNIFSNHTNWLPKFVWILKISVKMAVTWLLFGAIQLYSSESRESLFHLLTGYQDQFPHVHTLK